MIALVNATIIDRKIAFLINFVFDFREIENAPIVTKLIPKRL